MCVVHFMCSGTPKFVVKLQHFDTESVYICMYVRTEERAYASCAQLHNIANFNTKYKQLYYRENLCMTIVLGSGSGELKEVLHSCLVVVRWSVDGSPHWLTFEQPHSFNIVLQKTIYR